MQCPRAPTLEPSNKQPSHYRIFFVLGVPVFALSWLSAPVFLLGFSFPSLVLACSCLRFCSSSCFLFVGRGRRVPAPAGGTSGQVSFVLGLVDKGTDPRTGSFRYPSTYYFLVYLFAPSLFFHFHFAHEHDIGVRFHTEWLFSVFDSRRVHFRLWPICARQASVKGVRVVIIEIVVLEIDNFVFSTGSHSCSTCCWCSRVHWRT